MVSTFQCDHYTWEPILYSSELIMGCARVSVYVAYFQCAIPEYYNPKRLFITWLMICNLQSSWLANILTS